MPTTSSSVLAALAPELDELHESVGLPVTARRLWGQRWAETHPQWRPWPIVVRDASGGLAGAALLARRARPGLVDVVGLGHGWADHFAFPARDAASAAALGDAIAAAVTSLPRPWRLRVEQLPAHDPAATRARERLRCAHLVEGDPCPTLTLRADAVPNGYGSKKYRWQGRRAAKEIQDAGLSHEVRFTRGSAELRMSLDDVITLRRTRDRSFGRPSGLDTAQGQALFRALCDDLIAEGRLELATIRIGGALAAYDLLVHDGTGTSVWDGRIDGRFTSFSPGTLLTQATLVELTTRDDVGRVDFMRGDGEHKLRVADGVVATAHLLAWSSEAVRAITSAPGALRSRLRHEATARPRVMQAWRGAKRTALRLRA